jgi:nitrile hydratase
LFALEFLLERSDLVEPEELKRVRDEPHTVPPAAATPHVRDGAFRPEDARALAPSRGVRLEDSNVVAARFEPGQTVVARNIHPVGHTRLPRYARGRRGVIERDNGVSPFPDTTERRPQHVYSVRFEARELWGPGAAESDRIYIDLWDEYLDAG